MSAEKTPGAQRSIADQYDSLDNDLGGENSGVNVGQVEVDLSMRENFDPETLAEHPKFKDRIGIFHASGQEVFAQRIADKVKLTILGSALVAASVIGIGILVKRREHKDESK